MKFKKKKQIRNEELSRYAKDLHPLVSEIVAKLGFRLLKISFVSENQTNYLRLTITHPEHYISLDDCELVSKEVEKELDNKDSIPFSYILEVQSPGIQGENLTSVEHQFVVENLGLVVNS